MVPTVQWMSTCFNRFNKKYFKGKLQQPKFVVGCPDGYFGYLEYKANYNRLTRKITNVLSIPKLMLTNKYDRKAKDVANTMLHEMIHLYIYSVLKKYPFNQHGSEFNDFINDNNLEGDGWNISAENKLQPTDRQIDPNKPKQQRQKGQTKKMVNGIIKLNTTLDNMKSNNYFMNNDTITAVDLLKQELKKEVPQLTEEYLRKVINESIKKVLKNKKQC